MASLQFPGSLFPIEVTTIAISLLLLLLIQAIAFVKAHFRRRKPPQRHLPTLNVHNNDFAGALQQYLYGLLGLLKSGYALYKHSAYQIWGVDGYLTIVSTDFLDELIKLPRNALDFHGATQKRMIGDYTWLTVGDDVLARAIRYNLNRELDTLLPDLHEEIAHFIEEHFPKSKDWTCLDFQTMAPKLVATVMGRAFVGSPLNRDPELLTTALQFVSDVFAGGWKLKWYNISLRPFAARFLIPEIWRVWKAMGVARRMFRPAIEARMRACERDDEDDKEKPNHTLMQWIVEHGTKASPPRSVGNMAELTLLAYLGSTHTTATTLSSLLLDLAAHPDCVEGLRKEAKESQGGHDEVWSSKDKLHIRRTSKLDSCMKESQRLSPAFLMSFSRIVSEPFQLANGLVFPKGTHIICPAAAVSLDHETYNSPEAFRGFRFDQLRMATEGDATKYQFTTPTPSSLHFGYGREACPGRFLASAVIKLSIIHILTHYDIGLPDERPENHILGPQLMSTERTVLIRKMVVQSV